MKRFNMMAAGILLVLVFTAFTGCSAKLDLAKETDLPQGTTLLLLTQVKRSGLKRYAILAKAAKEVEGNVEAIGEQMYTFLLAEGDIGDFVAYGWEPGWDGLTSRRDFNSPESFKSGWYDGMKKLGDVEEPFQYSFNEDGEIDYLYEHYDLSGSTGPDDEY